MFQNIQTKNKSTKYSVSPIRKLNTQKQAWIHFQSILEVTVCTNLSTLLLCVIQCQLVTQTSEKNA